MSSQRKKDARDSSSSFVNVVWPILESECPVFLGHKLVENETVRTPVSQTLDMAAGIDWFTQDPGGGLVSISSRIQWECNWRSFTIRESRESGAVTELAKRREAIRKSTLCPDWWVHAYIFGREETNPELGSVGVIRTEDLFKWVRDHVDDTKIMPRRNVDFGGAAVLRAVWWHHVASYPSFWSWDEGQRPPKRVQPPEPTPPPTPQQKRLFD